MNHECWTPTQESEETHMRLSDIYSYWSQNTQNNMIKTCMQAYIVRHAWSA